MAVNTQRGAALVVSLLMLVVLTLIGVTSSRVITLEEKMTGNARDAQLAFQAAEAALRQGETYIQTNPGLAQTIWAGQTTADAGSNICSGGLCTRREDDPVFIANSAATNCSANWIDQRWVDSSCPKNLHVWSTEGRHREYVGTLPGVSSQPKYIIELVGCYRDDGPTVSPRMVWRNCGTATDITDVVFRVTSYAVGGASGTTMLQSVYRKPP